MSDQGPPPPKPYFLVIVAEGEPAALSQYASRDELVAFLRDDFHPEAGARVQVFIFQGDRLYVTRGGPKFLLQDGGPPTPLFHPPAPTAPPSESGDWFDVDDGDGPISSQGYTSYPGAAPEEGGLGDDLDS